MATAPFVHLGGANLSGTVLDNIKAGSPAQAFLSDTLNTALKAKLTSAATAANQTALVSLLQAIPAVDIAANKDLNLHDFVSKQVTLPADPTSKAAAEAAIAKLSTKTTVGDLLGLSANLKDNPIFTNEVNKVDLQALLGASPALGNPQLRDDFINRFANFNGPIQDFWTQLGGDAEFKAVVGELQLTLQLGLLTLNNAPLVTALRASFQPKSPRDLTKLSVADLTQAITSKNISVPDAIPGATPTEKVSNYANGMLGVLQGAFPTDYVAQGIAQLAAKSQNAVDLGVSQFLKNSPDFNFGTTNIDAYVNGNRATALQNIAAAQQITVINELKAYQRLFRVSTDFQTINTLKGAGFRSAYSIAMTPQPVFMRKVGNQLGGDSQAATIYAGAHHIIGAALSVFGTIRNALDGVSPMVTGNVAGQVQATLKAAGIPSWQTLFGSLSYCSCQDCRSVLSAAAYFVDLLQFLRNSSPNYQGYTPLDLLIGSADGKVTGRRPDLSYIRLNCENTNTPLPYVDLVNEILETFVVESASANPPVATLDKAAAHDTPANATADQLSVNPEYTNADAYNKFLNAAVYPPTLPFDRWLQTARIYLEFLGTSLYEVMNNFQIGGDPSDFTKGNPSGLAVACEYLEITEAEYTILIKADFSGNRPNTPLYEFYGYSTNTASNGKAWEQDLSAQQDPGPQSVPGPAPSGINVFLQRTGITYDDLVELLQTRFLNGSQQIVLSAPTDAPCDLTRTTIVDLSVPALPPAPPATMGGPLQDSTLDRIHRFIRLWKKLGWTIAELDKAMTALGVTDLSQNLIVSLAQLQQLQTTLNVPLLQLLSFWANIDTDGRDSLWIQLFQNKAVINPPDQVFQLNYVAPLAQLPTVSFPSPLFPNLEYDATAKQLTLTINSPMSSVELRDEQNRLLSLALPSDPNYANYTNAINSLFNLIPALGSGKFTASGLSGLPVAKLPPFPTATLPASLNYDAGRHQISFIGAMSDDQRGQLNFTNDLNFQTAVDDLYELRTLSDAYVAPIPAPNRIPEHVNTILAALRIIATDLNLLLTFTGMIDTTPPPPLMPMIYRVSVVNVSVLFRYALLARALSLSVGDLISLINLMGIVLPSFVSYDAAARQLSITGGMTAVQKAQLLALSPDANYQVAVNNLFTASQAGGTVPYSVSLANLPSAPFQGTAPAPTLAFVQRVQKLKSSPFSVAELNYLYRDLYDPNSGIAPLPDNVTLLLANLQSGLAKIARANIPVPDPNGDILRKKLATLLSGSLTDSAMGLINGTAVYSAPLAALPTISLQFVTYDPNSQVLSIASPMSNTQKGQLLALSPDPDYQSAVNNLYAAGQAGGAAPYSVSLSHLPDLLNLFLSIPISYDSAKGELVLSGVIDSAQTTRLDALSNDTTYDNAINTLFGQSSAGGSGVYTVSVTKLPSGVILPDQLKKLIAYDSAGQQLRFTGPMTGDEKSTLLALSTDPTYEAAVQSLYQQPRDFITQNLASFLDPVNAATQLIDNPKGLTTAAKIDYLTQKLMPYLRQTLNQSFIKQTLSDNLQIDTKLTDLLLSTVLKSQTNPSTTNAMADFLALAGDGLAASYFPNQALTGTASLKRTDPIVEFDWGFGTPDSTIFNARPFSIRWSGFLFPQYTEGYTFYVRTGDGVRLWVNGTLIIDPVNDQWKDQPIAEHSGTIALTTGQLADIKLEYYDNTASAVVELSWSSPSTPKAVIPQTQLFSGLPLTSVTQVFNSYNLLFKVALLAKTFGMTPDDVDYLSKHSADFGNLDLNALPLNRSDSTAASIDVNAPALFVQWERLNALFNLRSSLPGGDAGLFNIFAVASTSPGPSAAPALSQVAGGALPPATYYAKVTYTTAGSETLPSAESSFLVTLGNLLQVASPAAVAKATGWNLYVSASMGSETRQNSSPIPLGTTWTEPTTGLVTGAAPPDTTLAVLQATGWDPGELTSLTGPGGFNLTDADFNNEAGTKGTGLIRLQTCLALGGRLGVSTSQLFTWTSFGADPLKEAAISQDIQNTAKAKYDDSTWVTVGKPLNDKIREESKEALIAYILANAQTWKITDPLGAVVTDSDGLYEYFLIDVDMSPCMLTSRIVQANAAIQLFVQRCLMNLESKLDSTNGNQIGVDPSSIDAAQWEWRKNYRVWQANREVFLYPENWILPELRDDKTPFFQDLESELLQNDVTPDTVETAFRNYLNKLDEVSRLEICGMYWQNEVPAPTEQINILHVFGRTFSTPHAYYYRQWDVSTGVWSAWEKVDADIQGDHLIPVIWNRRLYLFWPMFLEVPSNPQPAGATATVKSLQLSMAWSEYQHGNWSKKQVSTKYLTPQAYSKYPDALNKSHFQFFADANGQASIWVFEPGGIIVSGMIIHGGFIFAGCGASPAVITEPSGVVVVTFVLIPRNTVFDYENLAEWDTGDKGTQYANKLVLVSGDPSLSQDVPTLGKTPTAFNLILAQQFFPNFAITPPPPYTYQPFFYEDAQKTYFVRARMVPPASTQLNTSNGIVGVYSGAQLMQGILSDSGNAVIFATASEGAVLSTTAVPSLGAGALARMAPALAAVGQSGVGASGGAAPLAHASTNRAVVSGSTTIGGIEWPASPQVTFSLHDHPHVCAFIKMLNWKGVPALLLLQSQQLSNDGAVTLFEGVYKPNPSVVTTPYPVEDVDFSFGGAYSLYNWELFFHIPLLIATRLSQNQRFEDAQKWFHYIFNPMTNSMDPIPNRYWNVLPFYQNSESERIDDLLTQLDNGNSDLINQVEQWEADPFNPHLIARMRLIAYQKTVVMKYIDNLIAWGDYLFRQNTRESINAATQIYVLAQEILGPRPVQIPARGTMQDYTYHDLITQFSLDEFSNSLVLIENQFPFSTAGTLNSGSNSGVSSAASAASTSFYFCVPPNDQLLGYWDTVADRLYKIRHCMNIAGVVQQLPLFAPPISPALLVRAKAMGVDLDSVLNDINASVPNYRFTAMLQKAMDLCSEVRSLGSAFLAALEKKDAEHLAVLRATQETSLLTAVKDVKQRQLDEANATLAGLQKSLELAQIRQSYYTTLLSAASTISVGVKAGPVDVNVSVPLLPMSQYELLHLGLVAGSLVFQLGQVGAELAAAILHLIPNQTIAEPGAPSTTLGGTNFGNAIQAFGGSMGANASLLNTASSAVATMAGYDRRAQEWDFQKRLAAKEIEQINQQIAGANIRIDIASKELANQQTQIDNAADVEDFIRNKYTSEDLYSWMVDQTSAIFFQGYQLAYETAKKSEKAFQFERGLSDSSYIQFGYWDSLKKGLLSGERLYLDLKRMETAYLDLNSREYEIIKNISLLLLDPLALITLKETGHCLVNLPEAFFDMDYPGHYMRRVKNVSLTIPCVTGPYTSVNCTLTLLQSKIRTDSIASSITDYASDSHFITNYAATQSIATSSAQNDSGMFELNFRDERYLPFEGAGVVSTWQIDLPPDNNAFDFETISDVIINLKYTAREGGDGLRKTAKQAAVMPAFALQAGPAGEQVSLPPQSNLLRLFSLKHEFPTEWNRFLNPPDAASSQNMQIALTIDRFPYQYRGRNLQISQIDLFLKFRDVHDPLTYPLDPANPTPLGDYAKGSQLTVGVGPTPGTLTPGTLRSATTLLNGTPFASIAIPSGAKSNLRSWQLAAQSGDIGKIAKSLRNDVTIGATTNSHLKSEVIDDIMMVCHYSATNT
jgi:hypothetical protein